VRRREFITLLGGGGCYMATRGAGAAGSNAGDRVSQHLASGIERTASRGIWWLLLTASASPAG